MSRRHYVNSATVTETTGAITSGALAVTVADASSYPASFPYTAQIDAGTASFEVVLVTAAAGNTLTIERGYDGTAAQAHAANASFAPCAVAMDYDEANSHVNATNNVHGVAGDVVGDTDTQTLTNKTLTAPTITDPVLEKSGHTVVLPAADDTLVGRNTTDTLTNKTLTAPVIDSPTINTATVDGATIDAASTIGGISGTAIANLPRGRVGGASSTNPTAVSTTEVFLDSMNDVSFTAVAGRRYKVTVTLPSIVVPFVNTQTIFRVRDGVASAPTITSTVLWRGNGPDGGSSGNNPNLQATFSFHFELTGLAAGTHRVGVTAHASNVNGLDVNSNAPQPGQVCTLTIEDIGI